MVGPTARHTAFIHAQWSTNPGAVEYSYPHVLTAGQSSNGGWEGECNRPLAPNNAVNKTRRINNSVQARQIDLFVPLLPHAITLYSVDNIGCYHSFGLWEYIQMSRCRSYE